MKIALLAPKISKYREPFYKGLARKFSIDFFAYQSLDEIKKQNMEESDIIPIVIPSLSLFSILRIYAIRTFLYGEYDILIIPAEIRSISTWILLLLKKVHKKKIILWGHGISVKNYISEEANYPKIKKIFHNLGDCIWLYTKKEKGLLQNFVDDKKITVLNNTLDIAPMLTTNYSSREITYFKKKHLIHTKINFIFSARFSSPYRRTDLLLEIIKNLDKKKYGFIIIGDGKYKPDFTSFENVYDFGSVYDRTLKNELFSIADMYLQPGWVGLSVVEALAYSKPVLTFQRTEQTKQCVEYDYIVNHYNGFIAKNLSELIHFIINLKKETLLDLQRNAKNYAVANLSMDKMILSAVNSIYKLYDPN